MALNDQGNAAYDSSNDEVGLGELLAKLWEGRWIVASITVVSILLASIYAFSIKERWTSQAVISAQRLDALGDYFQTQKELRRITGQATESSAEITADIFNEFIKQLNSYDFRRQHFSESAYYKQRAIGEKDNLSNITFLEDMVSKDFSVVNPDGKKVMYTQIKMSAESSLEAQKLLSNYLNSLNSLVWSIKNRELDIRIDGLKLDLSKQMQDMKADILAINRNQIEITNRALDTASKGRIESFHGSSYQSVPEQNMLFLLGTKSLAARARTLQDIPAVLPASYFNAERKFNELAQLPKRTNDNKLSVHFLSNPTLAIKRDSPKRALIMLLGGMLGFMLSSLFVLARDAMSELLSKPQLLKSKIE